MDHACHGLCPGGTGRMLSVLGVGRRPLSGGVQRLCQRHAVVLVRRPAARRGRHTIGSRAPACLFHHAQGRGHLSADSARADRDRLPADLHRAVGDCPCRDHGVHRAWACGSVQVAARKQCLARHVSDSQLYRQHLRQNDHCGRRLDHGARTDREGGRRRGAVELLVHRVPALQHYHGSRCLVADAVALPARNGGAERRQAISAGRNQKNGNVVAAGKTRCECSWRSRSCCG